MWDSKSNMNSRKIPVDLHDESRKAATGFVSLALILLAGALIWLGASARSAPTRFLVIDAELVDLVPPQFQSLPAPLPKPEAVSEPEPAPPPKPTPSKAELAFKQVQVSLAADRERREEEERKKLEEEQRKAEEERKQKEEEKKKREEEERKQREREEQRKAEEERRTAEEEQRKEEERKRREEEVELARRKAEELRAQADAAARAAEVERLAGLRGIYMGRIRAQIENRMDTPGALVGRTDVVVEVRVLLHSDGELKGWPKVIRSSGFPDYDEEAIRAVIQASPLLLPADEPELLREFLQLNLRIRPK